MATATINYASPATITMDLANLGSSPTWVAGRESDQIDNTTNKYTDAMVQGFVSVGTTPTANTSILVYVWGSDTSAATTALDTIDGADSAETITNVGVRDSFLRLAAAIPVTATTSDVQHPVGPFSVAALFGGNMPQYWGLWVTHNTAVNLRNNAVNTNSFKFTGIKYDVA